MATKPTAKPEWTVGNPSFGTITIEPSAGKKLAGWLAAERPAREYMNWLFWNTNEWIDYLEEVTDSIAGFANIYSAFVGGPVGLTPGFPATSTGLQDAITAGSVGDKILVLADISMDAQVQVTRNNMEIEFHPRVTLSKDAGAPATNFDALRVSATGVRLTGGRFASFSGTGDNAILIDSASDFTMVRDSRFASNDNDLQNDNGKSSIEGTITE